MKSYRLCGWNFVALVICLANIQTQADEPDAASAAPKPADADSPAPPPEKICADPQWIVFCG